MIDYLTESGWTDCGFDECFLQRNREIFDVFFVMKMHFLYKKLFWKKKNH